MTISSQAETASPKKVSVIASNTQILSSMPDWLTRQNITAAANIAVQIMKKPNVSEDFQVSLIRTKIRLVGLNIWDINSAPHTPAQKALFLLLTVHKITNKCINFVIQESYLSILKDVLVESLLGLFSELSVNLSAA